MGHYDEFYAEEEAKLAASGKLIEEGCWMDMEVMVDGEILTFYHCCSLHREDITPKVIQRIRALKLDEPDEPEV